MTTTSLKLLALVLMLIDHIGVFIPGMPVWFHWLGRLSAPLFLFCMVWGFHYTHDRKRYLKRMYLFGLGMGILVFICNSIVDNPYSYINSNIFVMLFLVAVICQIIETKKEDREKFRRYMLLFILFQIVSTVLCLAAGMLPFYGMSFVISALFPNVLFCEGSYLFILLGVLMYCNKDTKMRLTAAYGIFCIVYFLIGFQPDYHYMFHMNYQWMMLAALPFMLIYNGKKGKGLKYLFYIFYPVHIAALYFIGNLVF